MKRLALLAALFGCATDPSPRPSGRVASSIAVDGDQVWVASPDDGVLVALDPETLVERRRVPVTGEPHRVVRAAGRLIAIGARSDQLSVADGTSIPIPCGGATGMAALDAQVFIACPFDDRIVEVDTASGQITRVLAANHPTAVAIVDGRLVASASRAGMIRSVALDDLPPAAPRPQGAPWRIADLPTPGLRGHSAVQLDSLDVADDRLVGAYQIVQHDGDRDRAPEDGGYGKVVAGDPRIEPRVLADCGSAYARFDGGARAMSGPSAVALDPVRERLWVVNRGTGQVAVFGCRAGANPDLLPLVASFRIGDGARGIVLDAQGRAFVDVAFDHAVARLEVGVDPFVRSRETGPRSLSRAAETGRRLFHDARNVHLTPSGVVTCATCHPDGGEDGLAWFLHTPGVPRKLRRTPPAWAIRPEVRPLHWDGEFTSAEALVSTTLTELLEGDGLLIDTAAIAAYMRERTPPIPRPLDPEASASATRGAVVFADAGCAECHVAPDYTDGRAHAVLDPSSDPDGRLDAAITPSLIAIRARAPYLHDGRAATLEDVLDLHAPPLDDAARVDLLMFLRSL